MGYGRGYKLTKTGTEPVPEDFDPDMLYFSREQYDLISVDYMNVYKETYSGRPRKKLGETKRHIYTAREHVPIPVITVRCKRCGQIHQAQDQEHMKCYFGPCSPAWVNITNQRFGNLVALRYVYGAYGKHGKQKWYWQCKCDCGEVCYKDEHQLVTHSDKHHVNSMCPKCARHQNDLKRTFPDNRAQWNAAFWKASKGAADRGYAFELTFDEYKELCLQPCYYCGAPPSRHGKVKLARNGVDRFDNTKGYIHGNCVPCCQTCNRSKMDLPFDEWFAHISQIVKHINERSTTISKESTAKRLEIGSPEREDIV